MVPKGFKCVRCGACCEWEGPVRVAEDEVDAIAGFLKMDLGEFIVNHTIFTDDRRSLSLLEKPDGSCAFYDREKKSCLINPVKPRQCASFPAAWSFPGWERRCSGAKRALENPQALSDKGV